MFNLLHYGVVMKRIMLLALAVALLNGTIAVAEQTEKEKNSSEYVLDEQKTSAYVINEKENTAELQTLEMEEQAEKNDNAPKIITEKTPTGRIEKLLDKEGRVIAEKTIENDKIVQKILKYYYPNGQLLRQIITKDDKGGFYAEDYYMNGKIASRAMHVNEENKIGKEKKYDVNGTLRQEIPWILPKEELQKPIAERKTIRHGNLITYYPEGQIAASFSVGMKGKSTFFDYRGFPIKEVKDSEILNFSRELSNADCQGASIHLGLEELIDLYEDEGDISYNKCGFPYRENFVYEVVKKLGNRETKISYDEIGMIRRVSQYNNGKKDGIEKKYDAAGNLTAEINYKNGVKDGFATGYFPTKEIAFRKRYENGKVVDKLTCYFPTGDVAAEISYRDGLKEGIAIVNSPIKKEIQFRQGNIVKETDAKEKRQMVSALSGLNNIEEKCLNIDNRLEELMLDIDVNEKSIMTITEITLPEECENIDNFVFKKNKLMCYDSQKVLRASVPIIYKRGEYAEMKVYTPTGSLLYKISYLKKKKQGWSRKYDENGKVVAEIYFDEDKMKDSARSYYPNGQIKEIITISADTPHKMIARYDSTGALSFSLAYKDDVRQSAYIAADREGRDVVVRFYEGKPESIRESNGINPYNFIEYNLALGEYAVYNNNELISGGKLCNYQIGDDIDIIQLIKLNEATQPTEILQAEEKIQSVEELQPTEMLSPAESQPIEDMQLKLTEVIQSADEGEILSESFEDEISEASKDDEMKFHKASEILSLLPEENLPEPPVMEVNDAPLIEVDDIAVFNNSATLKENAIIPSEEEKKQVELAAKNIGPITKPDIEQLADVVQKQVVSTEVKYAQPNEEEKTEKLYYPGTNSLRKTIRTKGTRTEEVKEFSKNGLLLTDTVYQKDKIVIEKYYGSGEVRRRTEKTYDDNTVNAFINRKDFYDNGKPRYEIKRLPETMLFAETLYDVDGKIMSTTEQIGALSFRVRNYDKAGKVIKEYVEPNNSRIKNGKSQQSVTEYYASGKTKTEIIYYNNGEISVKAYDTEGLLVKFAYLSWDGKLHIEKPTLKIIPRYRDRYWVDYNNPKWIENQDKYSVKSIGKLNIDIVSKILQELNQQTPSILSKLSELY